MQISLYKNARDNKGKPVEISEIIKAIQTGTLQGNNQLSLSVIKIKTNVACLNDTETQYTDEQIKNLKTSIDQLKKELPAVTWSGLFEKRTAEGLLKYVNRICLDIDKVPTEEREDVYNKISADQYTNLLFKSPTGTGYKVIVKVQGSNIDHKENFLALEKYYRENLNIIIDPSGKDVNRLCFLSVDKDLFLNDNSQMFIAPVSWSTVLPEPTPETQPAAKPLTKKEQKEFTAFDNDLDKIRSFTDKKLDYSSGRNNYIHLFACNCNRKGVDINDCFNYVIANFSDKYNEDQAGTTATVQGAYDRNTSEAGQYKFTPAAPKNKTVAASTSKNNGAISSEKFTKFWWVTLDDKHTDVNGEPLERYNIDHLLFIKFLNENGFYKLRVGNNNYQFVRLIDKKCKIIQPFNIKDFCREWCLAHDEKGVLRKLIQGHKNYFNTGLFELMPYVSADFQRDTENACFLYFKNNYVEITPDEIKVHSYENLKAVVWEETIVDHDFTLETDIIGYEKDEHGNIIRPDDKTTPCEFAQFVMLVAHNPNSSEVIADDLIFKRFLSHCTSYGNLLHAYKKHPSKAIVAVDHKKSEKNEQNGRTGKSLVGKALQKMTKVATISGKRYREDDKFALQTIEIDSRIIFFNDLRANFPFESIFELVADDVMIERKQMGTQTIKYEDFGKLYLTTNFIFRGDGDSFDARMHVIEFSDFFTKNYTPVEHFKHEFFKGWDKNQWNLFYNFMIQCVQLYLNDGLIEYPSGNYNERKLIDDCTAEFLDLFDDVTMVPRNQPFNKLEIFKKVAETHLQLNNQKLTAHRFSKWVKNYCKTRGLIFNPQQKGGRDSRNGFEFYTLATGYDTQIKEPDQTNLFNNENQ